MGPNISGTFLLSLGVDCCFLARVNKRNQLDKAKQTEQQRQRRIPIPLKTVERLRWLSEALRIKFGG